MNKKRNPLLLRVPDPFDGSAERRLIRMGVLDKEGRIDNAAMPVFAGIFSALFFDDLCDFYDDTRDLLTICQAFRQLHAKQDYQHMFLLLSIQYDTIRKPLPDPIWWLAGDNTAVRAFMTQFLMRLETFMTEAEMEEPEEVSTK